jgi:predicted Fe-S protein YdhL (DUF1289 family)
MAAAEMSAAPIPHSGEPMSTKNPCISLCKFDEEICLGCGRSKREIKSWKKMEKDEKRSVLAESALRLIKLKGASRRKKK